MICACSRKLGLAVSPVMLPCRDRRQHGHTLIEILLALGLSLVILVAVYGALDQHWRYAEAGQRQTERMQVTRAIFERISLDLRSAVFRPAETLDHVTTEQDVTRVKVLRPEGEHHGGSVGVFGDAETIVVQANLPSGVGPNGTHLVHWKMHRPGADRRDAVNPARRRGTATTEQGTTGLARIGAVAVVALSTDAAEVAANDVLAAEVKSIRFRYFSQGRWFDRWDSVQRQELPRAVEITIGFRPADRGESRSSDQVPAGEYRLVVPIPAAEAWGQ